MKLSVKLNDFETFERILFTAKEMKLPEKERWKKYYDSKKRTVCIPIPMKPVTKEEHQFCHYVYWMTIWANELFYKPAIARKFGTGPKNEEILETLNHCFACTFKDTQPFPQSCPIKFYDCASFWASCEGNTWGPYCAWKNYGFDAAYAVAHLVWEEGG